MRSALLVDMMTSLSLDCSPIESKLEDEAHQRNTQTAADFPPGTSVLLTGDCRRWTVDTRYLNGDIALTRLDQRLYVTADQLWRIDPTR